jgi:hypothetical protein
VMIRDPNHNEIEVAVEKKNGKVYFGEGWELIQRFYKIFGGTWITLVYANRHLFLFELRNMHGEELFYPQFNPPQKLLLENQRAYDYRNSFIRYGSNAHFLPTKFSHLLVKELKEADVTTGSLVSTLYLMLMVGYNQIAI